MEDNKDTTAFEYPQWEKDLGVNETKMDNLFNSRGFVYIYLTKDNLTQEYVKGLKQNLLQIVSSIRKTLIMALIFSDELIKEYNMDDNLKAIQQILSAFYNIFEPEYSKQFPMVTIAIILPQVFKIDMFHMNFSYDAFFYDSQAISAEEFIKFLKENGFEDEGKINDIREDKSIPSDGWLNLKNSDVIPLVDEISKECSEKKFKYKMTWLGGTFDHLHLGHKLLLTNACFYTKEAIIIGITSSKLLSKKKWAHFLEDFETRKSRVKTFIKHLTNDTIEARIYELEDPCGPAGEIAEIEALILTPEVAKGGDYWNEIRRKNNLPECELVFVDMIENGAKNSDERTFSNKTSSSYIREYLDEKTGQKAKELYERFVRFCETVGIPESAQLRWWTKLRDSYCTHWRGFFNLNHIYYILEHFDKFYEDEIYGADNRILVELAIWFHRIVFLPLDIDYTYNVEQSYEIAEKFIKETGHKVVKKEDLELVKALIMSVHRHRQKVEFENEQHDKINKFFLDIILVFLGYNEEDYNKYKNAIGQSLLWSGKKLQQVELQGAFTITPEFILKRKVILKRLINRERIYLTDRLHEEFEEKARSNLQKELDE